MENKNIKKPNFFIIGAPRSATTAIQNFLANHPNIFIPPGEQNFFCKDFELSKASYKSKKEYLHLFKDAKPKHKIIGEKSVWYLPSKVAVKKIIEFNPDAKFLVMLRNPIEATQSLHSKHLLNGEEDIKDLEKAWELQKERKKGKKIPKGTKDPKMLQYREVYKLGKHLKRAFEAVPNKNQIKTIVFDDFKKNQKESYKEVLSFLGLPFDGKEKFKLINPSQKIRSKFLQKILNLLSHIPVRGIKRKLGIKKRFLILNKLKKLNQKRQELKPLPKKFKRKLADYFEKDILLLSDLIERDLTHWLNIK